MANDAQSNLKFLLLVRLHIVTTGLVKLVICQHKTFRNLFTLVKASSIILTRLSHILTGQESENLKES